MPEKEFEFVIQKEWTKKEDNNTVNDPSKPPKIRMAFKPLIAIPSPRNIPQVMSALSGLPYMKLFVKYHTAPEAYQIIRREFLNINAFSHLILIPDDLVVTKEKLDILINDVKGLPDTHFNNSIVCGFCNFTTLPDEEHLSNISHYLKVPDRKEREKEGYKFLTLDECRNFNIPPENPKILGGLANLFRVKFAGFPCPIIPREIVQNIIFRNDSPSGMDESGCCFDVMFCYDMHVNDYDIFIDKRVEFKHMRSSKEAITSFHLKDKDKYIIWDNGEVKNQNVAREQETIKS